MLGFMTAQPTTLSFSFPATVTIENAEQLAAELKGDYFSLRVDSIGNVLTIPTPEIVAAPANLTPAWRDISSGVYRLPGELMVIVNIESLIAAEAKALDQAS
jgi:purine-binding chemotaxis protein CheW